MWQKIKCWLGCHEWETCCTFYINELACKWFKRDNRTCRTCQYHDEICKHCGKVKR